MVQRRAPAVGVTDLSRLISLADVERAAQRRLPRLVWDVIAGGSGDEVTLRRNRDAFDSIALRPRALADVHTRDLSTTIFGERIAVPVLLAPTGFNRMAHRDAELAAARAAGRHGTVFTLGTITTFTPEQVAAAAPGPLWFQLYMQSDRAATEALVQRAERAGFSALVVTIDTAMPGIRERDLRNRLTVPLKITPRLIAQAATRPAWAIDFALGGSGRGAQGYGDMLRSIRSVGVLIKSSARQVTESDIQWLRGRWKGPLLVKGVLRGEDCDRIIAAGVDGIIVSNHGGRQLDSTPATIRALPEVLEAVAGRAEVLVDGGFRRGVDIAKALALGARAVLIGRPYIYGLAIGGEGGVHRVLEILTGELDHTFALLGCSGTRDIDRSYVAIDRAFAPVP
jgi:isopentenyl diphosphate isomerase/L-lactate dehydrogenase-like FMN-dependent dehydrogenase